MRQSNDAEMARGWPASGQFKKSIRLEFSMYVSAIILLLMLVTGYIITDKFVGSVTQSAVDKLLVQTRSYSGPAGKLILGSPTPDALLLGNICSRLKADNPDVYWVGIADYNDNFLAHTDIQKVISGSKMISVASDRFLDMLRDGEKFSLRTDTIFIVVPIRENAIALGYLKVASSSAQIANARTTSIYTVVTITAIMILLGIPLTMVALHRKLRPITDITGHLQTVDFDDIRFDIPVTSKNELGYLAETLRVMGEKLNHAQRDLIEKERISREFEIAHEIQSNILPREYPRQATFEFFGAYSSAREIGGDYYDFIDCDDDHLAFLVADVSGKSLPGMLVMLLTRDIVKRLTRTMMHPSEILCQVNKDLLPNIKKGMFVTMFVGLLHKHSGSLTFASAGHNPLIRISGKDDQIELIKTKGFPLGLMPSEQFDKRIESGRIMLAPDDWLIQYTDGVNEAQNEGSEEYGMERFIESLRRHHEATPSELIEAALTEHRSFVGEAPQFDDITLLAMKWAGQPAENNNIPLHQKAIHAGS